MTGPALPDLPPWICQTCGLPLELRMHPDVGTFQGHRPDDPDDHPAVPVRPPADYVGECDFCGIKKTTHVLPAKSFDAPIQAEEGYTRTLGDTGWSACRACATLIRRGAWDILLVRHQVIMERRLGEPMEPFAVTAVQMLWARLRENITGPLRPIERPAP